MLKALCDAVDEGIGDGCAALIHLTGFQRPVVIALGNFCFLTE